VRWLSARGALSGTARRARQLCGSHRRPSRHCRRSEKLYPLPVTSGQPRPPARPERHRGFRRARSSPPANRSSSYENRPYFQMILYVGFCRLGRRVSTQCAKSFLRLYALTEDNRIVEFCDRTIVPAAQELHDFMLVELRELGLQHFDQQQTRPIAFPIVRAQDIEIESLDVDTHQIDRFPLGQELIEQ